MAQVTAVNVDPEFPQLMNHLPGAQCTATGAMGIDGAGPGAAIGETIRRAVTG